MDLGPAPSQADELLAEIRDHRKVIAEREIATVRAIADWADQHVVDEATAACTITERGLDTGLPVAGPGAPLVSNFAVMQLSAVLGRTLDSGRIYVGQVVELAHRLPKLWTRVLEGRVGVWKALRVADRTRSLPLEAPGFVDRQLALVAAGMTWAQVDRLVDEALMRFDPDAAEEKRREAAEHRHFDIDLDHLGPDGLAHLSGTLDAADALDLDAAVTRRAKLLGQLGNEDSLDVRRSIAAGELARHDLSLDLEVVDEETGEITRTVPGRRIELVVHLNAEDHTVGRLGNTRTPISPEQIREWINTPGTQTILRPVLNLAGHQPVMPTRPPTASADRSPCVTITASSPTAPNPPNAAMSTTSCPTVRAGRPARATKRRCAGHITGSRPPGSSPTASSPPAPTTGPAPPAPGSSTPPAPTTSPPDRTPSPPTSSDPAPHPVHRRGHRHARNFAAAMSSFLTQHRQELSGGIAVDGTLEWVSGSGGASERAWGVVRSRRPSASTTTGAASSMASSRSWKRWGRPRVPGPP